MNFTISRQQMNELLDYITHRPDCELVVYRNDKLQQCTCRLVTILGQFAPQETQSVPYDERLLTNRTLFGKRLVPGWLCDLVAAKYRQMSHRGPYQPSEMSDG